MKLLAIDSSAGPASCAILEDGRLLAEAAVHIKLTHSQTLLPMVDAMLQNAALTLGDMDVLAVSTGPGSFTGVRIGVSAIKGMAFSQKKPCASVSTLAAIARGVSGIPFTGTVYAVMDARCHQVYAAAFHAEGGTLSRLTPDEAISLEEWENRAKSFGNSVLVVGDGAKLCYTEKKEAIAGLLLAPERLRFQHAVGVALEATEMVQKGELMTAEELRPCYLRLPQAERELKARKEPAV